MLPLSLSLILAAQAAPSATAPPARTRVLVLDLIAQGVDADTTGTIAGRVASAVAADPALDVISGADLRAIVDVESNKQTLGCDASSQACLAELAGALSAELVVSGSVGRLGSLTVVTLSVYDAKQQQSAGKRSFQEARVEDLLPHIDASVNALFHRDSSSASSGASSGALSPLFLGGAVTTGLGALALVGTGIGAGGAYAIQDDPTSSGDEKKRAEGEWPLWVTGVAASAVVVGAGAGLMLWGAQ